MALKHFSRVREDSSTNGTADFTLGGAVIGGKTFASRFSNGDTTHYLAESADKTEWEIGLGTYNSGVLERTTVTESSNSDTTVNFTDPPQVCCVLPGPTFDAGGSSFSGALLHLTGDQTSPNNTTAVIDWDASVYDTDSWYDHAAHPSRLTAPSGVNHVVLTANLRLNSAATFEFILLKNGAQVVDGGFNTNATALAVNVVSAPLAVSPGDYFELMIYTSSPQTIDHTKVQWFSIEKVD